ncbi:MAG: 4,5-DOPA dioxygenase extradiol [Steroidobacteraceae bacterium]|nr:4,5-DOPA dioxygenase extradiol [Deltaproteobacteria bacterium]
MTTPAKPNTPLPALFIGHGNPMNAIQENVYAAAWRAAAAALPRPKAILCISAHWETEGTFVTAMTQPKTIHDFYGFPDELNQVQYPAPGSPELAERLRSLVTSTKVRLDYGYSWGLDHGAWSVLRRMYPQADIPTVQLSLDRSQHPRFHYDLGSELAALRQEGVLIVGSGNIVHNLRLLQWDAREPYPWATEFDKLAEQLILAGEHDRLVAYPALGEAARLAIPTNEHYLPLLYILALQQPGEAVSFFAEGLPLGSISMRSVRLG